MGTTHRFILLPAGLTARPEVADQDTVEDVGLYQIVDTESDFVVGEVGVSAPPELGLDALWAWRDSNGNGARHPFISASDALDNFIEEVEV